MFVESSLIRWEGSWYRAIVLSTTHVDGAEKVMVFFVDYGNSDILNREDLKAIHPSVLSIIPIAIKGEFR